MAESVLARGGPGHLSRRLRAGRTLILAYHNIIHDEPNAGADRSLHLTQERFAEHIAALRHTHDLVSLEDALASPGSGRPRAAITFDDAYAGAVQLGVDVLAEARVPATMFVAPGRLGGQDFWWDAVAGPQGPGPSPAFRDRGLAALEGRDAPAREAAAGFGPHAGPGPP